MIKLFRQCLIRQRFFASFCSIEFGKQKSWSIYKDHRLVINFSESNRNRVAESGITHNDTDYVDS